jgi:hypothetical protein
MAKQEKMKQGIIQETKKWRKYESKLSEVNNKIA